MSIQIDFSGRCVIVTGGTRGVGKGISERFLAAGADVVICGRNAPDALPEANGREAVFVAADVREIEQSRDKPGGTYAWGRGHLEHAARVLGVQAKSKKALVLAVDAEVDRRRASGGAGAGLGP